VSDEPADEPTDERCRVCGAARDLRDPAAVAWAVERDAGGHVSVICPHCTRRHARDIESGLPAEYW